MTHSTGFKSQWQGLNRMFGESGQIPYGEFVLIGGLPHSYKTGLLYDLLLQVVTHTAPPPSKDNLKPTVLFLTGDDNESAVLARMYVQLKEVETGEFVDATHLDETAMLEYVKTQFAAKGWHVIMSRYPMDTLSVQRLTQLIPDYEKDGFDVRMVFIDDISLTLKQDDLKASVRDVRKFMKSRNILVMATHSISYRVLTLRRELGEEFLTHLPHSGLWAGPANLSDEVDLELFVNRVDRGEQQYLELQRGKHRTLTHTPEDDRHTYLPFTQLGHLPSDLLSTDRSLTHPSD